MNQKVFTGSISVRGSYRFQSTDPKQIKSTPETPEASPAPTMRRKVDPIIGKDAQEAYLGFSGEPQPCPRPWPSARRKDVGKTSKIKEKSIEEFITELLVQPARMSEQE